MSALDADVIERMRLQPVTFELKHEIEFPGSPIRQLFFVEEGMASKTATFEDGSQVEVGMFGWESVIGACALMGARRSMSRIYTQIAGCGYSCSMEDGRREFERGGLFQTLVLRSVQMQLVHASQSVGCNSKHPVERRLARWLLDCADKTQSLTYKLSQEFLADMLGSTRPTISIAAAALKDRGLIRYSRGTIQILDVGRLEREACECYRIVRDYLGSYTDFGGCGTT